MAYDKVVDSAVLDEGLKQIADAIREKAGTTDALAFPQEIADAIAAIQGGGATIEPLTISENGTYTAPDGVDGYSPVTVDVKGSGGGSAVDKKDVTFYDYDGSILYSYTLEDAQSLTELPKLPEHNGLVCQGWNYDLDTIKRYNRAVDIGAMYITDDGTTRLYVRLRKGRTSPMLALGVNGTVTVDWGDGTENDVLTGTNTSTMVYTSNHENENAGDYVIKLAVEGQMAFPNGKILRGSETAQIKDSAYSCSLKKVEIGTGVQSISNNAFYECLQLEFVIIPKGVIDIGGRAFGKCTYLNFVAIPSGVTSIVGGYSMGAFMSCGRLKAVSIPDSVKSLGDYVFEQCYSLAFISVPDGVTKLGTYALSKCSALTHISTPDHITTIGSNCFEACRSLTSFAVPNGVTSISAGTFNGCTSMEIVLNNGVVTIGTSAFSGCYQMTFIDIPSSVNSIGSYAFRYWYSVRYFDFSQHTTVPTLVKADAFDNVPDDCEIRVPSVLYDEWIAATNWSTLADHIVAV